VSGTTSPTAAYVDMTGIHAPSYADVLSYLNQQFQAIYGSDIVITPDSQDGQMIGIMALAISDTNAAAVAVYNSFSPQTARGVGLSTNVKINGLTRAVASFSTVQLDLVGQAYTLINNGAARDNTGQVWLLPPVVEIPASGAISVTGTAQSPGALTAPAASITTIVTVTRGWQTVNNPLAAVPGAPVETDPLLRQRQSVSTANPSLTVLNGVLGAVLAVPGVTEARIYENDTGTDYSPPNPPPPVGSPIAPISDHAICVVARGGDPVAICEAILLHKTPGCYTFGNQRRTVNDPYGLPHDIGYDAVIDVPVGVAIQLTALAGYSTMIGAQISASVASYINSLGAGEDVVWSKLWNAANLCDWTTGVPVGATNTFDITAITLGTPPSGTAVGYSTANIPIDIFQEATCLASDVVITAT